MDHSNLASQQCTHGKCLNHGPEWENVGEKRREPNPGFWFFSGVKTYRTNRCCGEPMARYKVVQTHRCKKCGRTEDEVTNDGLALCLCCGRHLTITSDD